MELAFIAGGIVTWLIIFIVYKIEQRRIVEQAEYVRRPDETIECYDATIMVDDLGRISWIDNAKKIKIYKG